MSMLSNHLYQDNPVSKRKKKKNHKGRTIIYLQNNWPKNDLFYSLIRSTSRSLPSQCKKMGMTLGTTKNLF